MTRAHVVPGTAPSDGDTPDSPSFWGTPRRWAVFLVGGLLLGTGVALSITANVGVGSWQVLETGLVTATGGPFAVVVIVESLLALALAWLWLRQPPGIATVVIALGIGPLIGLLLDVLPAPASMLVGVGQFTIGTVLIGLGIGLYVAAELGPSAQDALFVGLYRRYPVRPRTARLALDATLVGLGFSLGGQLGIGTAVVTFGSPLVVEPALRLGHWLAGTNPAGVQVRPARYAEAP